MKYIRFSVQKSFEFIGEQQKEFAFGHLQLFIHVCDKKE